MVHVHSISDGASGLPSRSSHAPETTGGGFDSVMHGLSGRDSGSTGKPQLHVDTDLPPGSAASHSADTTPGVPFARVERESDWSHGWNRLEYSPGKTNAQLKDMPKSDGAQRMLYASVGPLPEGEQMQAHTMGQRHAGTEPQFLTEARVKSSYAEMLRSVAVPQKEAKGPNKGATQTGDPGYSTSFGIGSSELDRLKEIGFKPGSVNITRL